MRIFFLIILLVVAACESAPADEDWVTFSGGDFVFGNKDGMENEKPEIKIHVSPFEMQATEVSNAQFQEFVNVTYYATDAEKSGFSMVYAHGTWQRTPGADWKHPMGKDSSLEGKMDHPVVNVSYHDALAYCKWIGGRLPSEMEWEYARKSGNKKGLKMNISVKDTIQRTAEVKALGRDLNGMYQLAGNVWEWCADAYHYEVHDKRQMDGRTEAEAYMGKAFDPLDRDSTLRVIRGGSFLCDPMYCAGYLPYARQHAPAHGSYFHIGFRVVKDVR